MLFSTRHDFRRGLLAALAIVTLSAATLAGCSEDRSNLIQTDDSQTLIDDFNQIQELSAAGLCFEANDVATETRGQIEEMRELDPELKRSLLRGVSRLQRLVGNQEVCTDQGEEAPVVEPVTEETPEGATGETGSTDTEATTGEQGTTTDENRNPRPSENNGNGNGSGNGNQTPNPTPTNPTTPPTTPVDPNPPNSGGLGPG